MSVKHSVFAVLAVLALLAAPASAGLVHNEDGRAHEITFMQGRSRVQTSVEANTAIAFQCREAPCKIKLVETGQSVKIHSADDDVVIENGKLTLRAKNAKR